LAYLAPEKPVPPFLRGGAKTKG